MSQLSVSSSSALSQGPELPQSSALSSRFSLITSSDGKENCEYKYLPESEDLADESHFKAVASLFCSLSKIVLKIFFSSSASA
jgi:hypothetical protein